MAVREYFNEEWAVAFLKNVFATLNPSIVAKKATQGGAETARQFEQVVIFTLRKRHSESGALLGGQDERSL